VAQTINARPCWSSSIGLQSIDAHASGSLRRFNVHYARRCCPSKPIPAPAAGTAEYLAVEASSFHHAVQLHSRFAANLPTTPPAGNVVIWKAVVDPALSAHYLMRLLERRLRPCVINLVTGSGRGVSVRAAAPWTGRPPLHRSARHVPAPVAAVGENNHRLPELPRLSARPRQTSLSPPVRRPRRAHQPRWSSARSIQGQKARRASPPTRAQRMWTRWATT